MFSTLAKAWVRTLRTTRAELQQPLPRARGDLQPRRTAGGEARRITATARTQPLWRVVCSVCPALMGTRHSHPEGDSAPRRGLRFGREMGERRCTARRGEGARAGGVRYWCRGARGESRGASAEGRGARAHVATRDGKLIRLSSGVSSSWQIASGPGAPHDIVGAWP